MDVVLGASGAGLVKMQTKIELAIELLTFGDDDAGCALRGLLRPFLQVVQEVQSDAETQAEKLMGKGKII